MFNLLVGRRLQKEFGQEPQVLVMMPLLEGLDGSDKMSKSLDNYVGIEEDASTMFGKIMSIPDDLILRYFRLLTDVAPARIEELEETLAGGDVNPMKVKKELAAEIVKRFHDERAAEAAASEFERVFSEGELPEDMPQVEIASEEMEGEGIWIVDLIAATGMVDSNSEARRLIEQGAVSLDGDKVTTVDCDLHIEDEMILKIGKRRYARIRRGD